jgi:hypothetical protein
MESVFLVQHLHVKPDGIDEAKIIGIYRSRAIAEAAIARVASAPGFRDHSTLVVDGSSETSGFYIDEYRLDQDHWEEGYVTA